MRSGPWALAKLICESVGCSGEILQVSSSPGGVPVPSAQDHDVARALWNGPAAPTTVRRWARPQELSCVDPQGEAATAKPFPTRRRACSVLRASGDDRIAVQASLVFQ